MAKKNKEEQNGRWMAIFKCKMCGARIELDGAINGLVSCHLYKTQQTHECYEGLKVGILEQVGAQRVP